MYEYRLFNPATGEEAIIFGRDILKAFNKTDLNPMDWVVWDKIYVD